MRARFASKRTVRKLGRKPVLRQAELNTVELFVCLLDRHQVSFRCLHILSMPMHNVVRALCWQHQEN